MAAKRTKRKLGLNVPLEMADRLRALSERTLIPQSKLLQKALELLFDEYPEERPPTASKARKP